MFSVAPIGRDTLLQVPVVPAQAAAVTVDPPIEINASVDPSLLIETRGYTVVEFGSCILPVTLVTASVAETEARTEKPGGEGGAGCACPEVTKMSAVKAAPANAPARCTPAEIALANGANENRVGTMP